MFVRNLCPTFIQNDSEITPNVRNLFKTPLMQNCFFIWSQFDDWLVTIVIFERYTCETGIPRINSIFNRPHIQVRSFAFLWRRQSPTLSSEDQGISQLAQSSEEKNSSWRKKSAHWFEAKFEVIRRGFAIGNKRGEKRGEWVSLKRGS